MSAVPPPPRQMLTIRASRETVVLLVAVTAMTLAIGHAAHRRPAPDAATIGSPGQVAAGEWTGQLASPAAAAAPASTTVPLSSDALTLPKTALDLPAPTKQAAPAKTQVKTAVTIPAPARRPQGGKAAAPRIEEASLMQRLNPLNHLPDMVKRPFASAGEVVAGWVGRF